ncbi:MAG: hypothetical protein IT385_07810 [Deltaproteobacteria bacterium]|nr:hypothetical protein [Deltaproteobacteria bacterium]
MTSSKLVVRIGASRLLLSFVLIGALVSAACRSHEYYPLVGEDPEVARLIPVPPEDDPRRSPLAAARRLHQALMQDDADTVWALLAEPTRKALDDRGAAASSSGRELIDRSMLPGPGGTMRTVRYESILFGTRVFDLREPAGAAGDEREVEVVAEGGEVTAVRFVREDDGWKLLRTGF